jgi:large subunit ribosomal protein L6
MSRVAKYPVKVPNGVEIKLDGDQLSVKGGQGTLSMTVHPDVVIGQEEGQLTFAPSESAKSWAMVGTTRALVQNLVTGVSEGFTKFPRNHRRRLSCPGQGPDAQSVTGLLAPGRLHAA